MVAELDPVRKFPCTYPDCAKSFASLKEMKLHKQLDPDHDYCKKCDVDCASWVDLTGHKVAAMAPFLEGQMKDSDESPKHIVCEFCGQDFKSFGGRKRHREQNHPADQSITCPGCKLIFVRAAHMVAHLEQGDCSVISAFDFRGHIQQKYINREMAKDLGGFSNNMQRNHALTPQTDTPGLIMDDDEDDDGGAKLLDLHDSAQKSDHAPLQANVGPVDVEGKVPSMPLTRKNLESWPRLPGPGPAHLAKSMKALSIDTSGQSVGGAQLTPSSQTDTESSSPGGGVKIYTESYPPLASPSLPEPTTTSDTNVAVAAKSAWTTGKTSKALFGDAAPTPSDARTLAIMEEHALEASKRNNLFHARFWDSTSDEYDPQRFFDTLVGKYVCPFPSCGGEPLDTPQDIEMHFACAHTKTQFQCPLCLKVFGKASSLIAHAESNGNCKIQQIDTFRTMVDEISGGFLDAKALRQPAIYRPGAAVVKSGQTMEGVMNTRYKAKMPQDQGNAGFTDGLSS